MIKKYLWDNWNIYIEVDLVKYLLKIRNFYQVKIDSIEYKYLINEKYNEISRNVLPRFEKIENPDLIIGQIFLVANSWKFNLATSHSRLLNIRDNVELLINQFNKIFNRFYCFFVGNCKNFQHTKRCLPSW